MIGWPGTGLPDRLRTDDVDEDAFARGANAVTALLRVSVRRPVESIHPARDRAGAGARRCGGAGGHGARGTGLGEPPAWDADRSAGA
ncbi:hypothetical protein GCM10010172_82750 [Paractinoplanes ferrugineus]|uniref:Uncharacterized protein n=1 Tax=Paractinoplanes ferrugineus TaxID=113564 RepID=A0A919J4T2_9ACTN|nr:hypothetical protein Afe05nite_24360 [Actinoplanes ferrugineus]